mmetsp:Transcript_35379/g.85347  ORF Transcript_35379/g.85347 Transcript_35379/m.85347 type:complete len:369 (+) Transcript_35379:729-1835(+)
MTIVLPSVLPPPVGLRAIALPSVVPGRKHRRAHRRTFRGLIIMSVAPPIDIIAAPHPFLNAAQVRGGLVGVGTAGSPIHPIVLLETSPVSLAVIVDVKVFGNDSHLVTFRIALCHREARLGGYVGLIVLVVLGALVVVVRVRLFVLAAAVVVVGAAVGGVVVVVVVVLGVVAPTAIVVLGVALLVIIILCLLLIGDQGIVDGKRLIDVAAPHRGHELDVGRHQRRRRGRRRRRRGGCRRCRRRDVKPRALDECRLLHGRRSTVVGSRSSQLRRRRLLLLLLLLPRGLLLSLVVLLMTETTPLHRRPRFLPLGAVDHDDGRAYCRQREQVRCLNHDGLLILLYFCCCLYMPIYPFNYNVRDVAMCEYAV